jgi:hypothetical protein
MTLIEAKVRHTDNNTVSTLHARADRLEEFRNLTWDGELLQRMKTYEPDPMPGISGAAAAGLSTIFSDIPSKFPIKGLMLFLQGIAGTQLWEVEVRLEVMGHRFSGIDCEGNDVF